MTLIPVKRKSKAGTVYYNLIDEKRINGKVVQKYVEYLGKFPSSRNEIEPNVLLQYFQRLLKKGISQEDIDAILKKMHGPSRRSSWRTILGCRRYS